MKMLITGVFAALIAGAAMAQTITPVEPRPPAGDAMAPAPPPGAPVAPLVERDGKWWNGDREATPEEIAAFKKAQRDGSPR